MATELPPARIASATNATKTKRPASRAVPVDEFDGPVPAISQKIGPYRS
jgi:hypothetical protein